MEETRRKWRKTAGRDWRTSVLLLRFNKGGTVPEGTIWNLHIPEEIPFRGWGDMIMKMDRIYDLLDYPQMEWKLREWDDQDRWKGTLLESGDDWDHAGAMEKRSWELCTGREGLVYVETRFRRYGSWQGILQAGKRKRTYRSALEFLHYLTGYVSETMPGRTKQPCAPVGSAHDAH